MTILLADPGDSAIYSVDVPNLTTEEISSVTLTLPTGITQFGGVTVDNTGTPFFSVQLLGGSHGQTYSIEAAITLDTGEVLNRNFSIRVFNG